MQGANGILSAAAAAAVVLDLAASASVSGHASTIFDSTLSGQLAAGRPAGLDLISRTEGKYFKLSCTTRPRRHVLTALLARRSLIREGLRLLISARERGACGRICEVNGPVEMRLSVIWT